MGRDICRVGPPFKVYNKVGIDTQGYTGLVYGEKRFHVYPRAAPSSLRILKGFGFRSF